LQQSITVKGDSGKFIEFDQDVSNIELPEKFTFPFYYEPHPIAMIAAEELQSYLEDHNFGHDFGIQRRTQHSIGKMFGVLVVQKPNGQLGYLAAFSGKVADSNDHEHFVPPVFDMLTKNSFFRKEELEISEINRQVAQLENDPEYVQLQNESTQKLNELNSTEKSLRDAIIQGKQDRKKTRREQKEILSEEEFEKLCNDLAKESIESKLELKQFLRYKDHVTAEIAEKLAPFENKIKELKRDRANRSNVLQKKLFNSYQFLNIKGENKSLLPIFEHTSLKKPPAGAGECAAPKLLQYAFEHDLKPIALAEFWWGAPPNTEIRTHKNYYPACQGKCEPILGHMLKGIELDENPLIKNYGSNKEIEVIYEDDHIMIINKPHDLLSVPGKNIKDSVYTRILDQNPNLSGPVIVHRLDMATSGLMVLAKEEVAYKLIQRQFLDRSVKKTYTALLEGVLDERRGRVELPMRLDIYDRPRQCVCHEHGKWSKTDWRVDYIKDGRTRIIFKPITGRTHQLRVHAAHKEGLKTPIVGDDLYGTRDERLYLHATTLTFEHPKTKEIISFNAPAPF